MRMKQFNAVIFLSFLMMFILVTHAIGSSDWLENYTDKNGDILLYKIERRTNHIVQVWAKRVFSDDGGEEFVLDSRNNGLNTRGWNKLGHLTSLCEVDCLKRKDRVLSVVIFAADGKVVYSGSFGTPGWDDIVPDSIGDSFRKKVCE